MLLVLLDANGGFLGGAQPTAVPGAAEPVALDIVRRYADDLKPPQYLICEGSVEQDDRGGMAGRRSGTWRVLHHQRGADVIYNAEQDGGWRAISAVLDEHGHFLVSNVYQ